MTVLQLILLVSHLSLGYIMYNWGKAEGIVEGRKAVRKHYENLMAIENRLTAARTHQVSNMLKDQA